MNAQPNPFEDYYLDVLKNKYALFTGRARRSEYWYFTLFNIIVSLGLGMIDAFTGIGFLSSLYGLAVIIPSIVVGIRRLHDTGKSGWWLLIALVPFIGWIILIYFLIQDSQPHDNQYGPSPERTQIII
ncbi:MAG: DUF805 domain-containing protein [Anditalea sp.]